MDFIKHLASLLPLFLFLLLSAQKGLQQAEAHPSYRPTKLFVFGDSYVDTGNIKKGLANSWKVPYGITFPGKPAGRFSDGRVFTDFLAKYLGLKLPLPCRLRKQLPQHLKYGVNFAFGGTGVFKTSAAGPNMTTQIDLFQQLINGKVYTPTDLRSSIALISVAGNDYSFYLAKNGTAEGFPALITSVVNQLSINLKRLQPLGLKKIVVNGLQPLGCLPFTTFTSSFQQCSTTFTSFVDLHNKLLNQSVTKLNQDTKHNSNIVVLDLFYSFMSVLNHPKTHDIKNGLKPCCVGVGREYSCGIVDENNVKKYSLCDDPKTAFFWDLVHPTQAGWHAVYNKLRTTSTFQQLLY